MWVWDDEVNKRPVHSQLRIAGGLTPKFCTKQFFHINFLVIIRFIFKCLIKKKKKINLISKLQHDIWYCTCVVTNIKMHYFVLKSCHECFQLGINRTSILKSAAICFKNIQTILHSEFNNFHHIEDSHNMVKYLGIFKLWFLGLENLRKKALWCLSRYVNLL